jgi:hypothetical protein
MHKVQKRQSRVLIYTHCKGDDVDLRGDDDGDVDVDVDIDDEVGTSPYAKGVMVVMMVSNSPRRRP